MLDEARTKSGLTQEQIAERLGQDQAMVSRCFTGSRRVDIVELDYFCRVLGVRLSDLVQAYEGETEELRQAALGRDGSAG